MDQVAEIEDALGKHALWMSELRQAVLYAPAGIDVESIRADDRCEFGRWLYGSHWSSAERASESYEEVRRVHAEFHQLAGEVVDLAASGRTLEAYGLLYGDYVTISGRLAIAMRAWQAKLRNAS